MSEDCPYCVFEQTEANCRGCFEGSHYKPKPTTNADRIRAMDIDHLIEWFCRGRPCGTCQYSGVECGIRDWLRQEAEE